MHAQVNTQHLKDQLKHRVALQNIFSTINLLGQQGLALRGSGSDAESNFRRILLSRAEDVPELKEWLAKENLKYQSHDIQDEIILIYAPAILKQVVAQIREAKFFSKCWTKPLTLRAWSKCQFAVALYLRS